MNAMRAGDIVCHMYHGIGETILDANGKVLPEVAEARNRGVFFDVANGINNFSTEIAIRAMEQGFLPDLLSTDMGLDRVFYDKRVRSLPLVMSKFLSLGMSLKEVVRCVTETPALLMGMKGRLGTLAPGAFANVSIFRLENREICHTDVKQFKLIGKHLLIPQMAIAKGQIAFGQIDFSLSG